MAAAVAAPYTTVVKPVAADNTIYVSTKALSRDKMITGANEGWDLDLTKNPYRIVSAMTTTPKRLKLMEPCLKSLLAQTHPLDAIYIFVPWKYLRKPEQLYEMPEFLKQMI